MATQNVKFYFGTQAKYDALVEKNSMALYFIEDTQRLYKGYTLIASGANATAMASGLMSAEDKIKLDELVAGGGLKNLSPVDGTIVIADKADGGKSIGVGISAFHGNILSIMDDGLYAAATNVPEYTIEKQPIAESGFATSYKLKMTVDGASTYVGDTINIAKDMVLQGATLETVTEVNVPYAGAVVGDPYIDMVFNDATQSHIYVPVKGLVDTYTAGEGIEIIDGKISVKIAKNSHGLVAVDGSMTMLLATSEQDGAMSKEDKKFIDSIPTTYATTERVKETTVQAKYDISNTPDGTLVNYGEREIRIMCPADAKFVKQQVGSGGNANIYYMTFTTYAPDGAVTFKEGDRGVLVNEVLNFETTSGAGVDKYGRKYKNHWFALATYDETSDSWTYFGENSSTEKYIGWDYIVEWYDINNIRIGRDQIRINLTNEDCHDETMPYYMSKYVTEEQISVLEESVGEMTESFTWGEM
jgi:hypothetical protein